jgi:hypothetical protein
MDRVKNLPCIIYLTYLTSSPPELLLSRSCLPLSYTHTQHISIRVGFAAQGKVEQGTITSIYVPMKACNCIYYDYSVKCQLTLLFNMQ